MAYTVNKLLEIAQSQIGYHEKASNSQLDNPTANSGSQNYTKYARDLHAAGYYQASKQGYAWCDMFVDWCFLQLCDGDAVKAQEIICQTGPYGAGCEWSARYYKQQGRFYTSNPQPGDQVFFNGFGHTGIVEEVTASQVITIEGNTGDQVARRYYSIGSGSIDGYGRPKFDAESVSSSPVPSVQVPGVISTGSASDERTIWNYLMNKIGNAFGAAGLMGNLYAESALRSNNLQNSYEARLGYTDAAYTAAVDNGTYGNFVRDAAGYGLAQWTFWSRKQALLDYAKSKNKSIGDLTTQLEFLVKELNESYRSVLNDLKNADSVLAASNSVLMKYECPADQSAPVQNKRAGYGQEYYDKYASGGNSGVVIAPPAASGTPSAGVKVGDVVSIASDAVYYNGVSVPAWVKAKKWIVSSVNGNRAVINKSEDGSNAICSPIHIKYLSGGSQWVPAVGDIVFYNGAVHYPSSEAGSGYPCKEGKAKITQICRNSTAKHPYHLVRIAGGGGTVYGWVDAGSFTKA